MSSSRDFIGTLVPPLFTRIIEANRLLAPVSNHHWVRSVFPMTLMNVRKSRLSILPLSFRRSPGFVIDVGANQGQWIGALLHLLPITEVWIFEPNPDALKICQKRIGKRPGIKYFDMALGETVGKITLHVTAASNFASALQPRVEFLEKHYSKNAARIVSSKQVEVTTLDSIVPESKSVDLLKIDVQGFERAVLSGARTVLTKTRCVLIEMNLQPHYVGDDTLPLLWSILADHGFSFWALSPPYAGRTGESLWADAVFLRKDSELQLH
jgi:FkbM family methyltransferase